MKHETKAPAVLIPEDVSEKIKSLQIKLMDSLKMYEELEKSKMNGNKEGIDAMKKSVKGAIERFESELQKLIDHQKRRKEIMDKVEAEKKESASRWRGRGSRGWRGRGGRGWRGRGRGR